MQAGSASAPAEGAPALGVAASIALYLGVLGGSALLGAAALGAGVSGGVVAGVGFFSLCALFLALERWRPWQRAWNGARPDLLVDAPLILAAAPAGLVVQLADSFARDHSLGVWPSHWPLLAQAVLALLSGDFARYWFHRASHAWRPLWRIHATHHSAERLYCINGPRLHPLEVILSGSLQTGLLALLGARQDALALQLVLTLAIGRFQHCNLSLTLGPLDYVFSAPDPHRWHHARDPRVARCNFGGEVLLWDHLFGTFFLPRGRAPSTDVGIPHGEEFPRGFFGVLLSPFAWPRFRERE